MQLSLVSFAAKKGRTLLVLVKSTASRHTMLMLRDRFVDKYEFIRMDPLIDQEVLYKEQKKLRTVIRKRSGDGD